MSSKITLSQIIEELSDEALLPKSKSQDFVNALVDTILEEIETKGKSAITNFGSFTVVEVAERTGVNPKTGEPLIIPAHKRISFTPYKALEKKVNRDFDHLEAKVVEAGHTPEMEEEKKETLKNQSEELFETLVGGKAPEPEDESLNTRFEQGEDDPFDFGEEEAEETTKELELDLEEEAEPAKENIEESVSEEKTFRTPGRPERKSNGVSPLALLGVLAIFVIAVFAVWYFVLRSEPTPPQTAAEDLLNDPSLFENGQNLSEVNDAGSDPGDPANEPDNSQGQVIPMIAPEVDLNETPGEVMTIENQEPQIEVETFTPATYNVSAGVWIYEIARQTYGNTRLWPLIFQANYTLANDPDLILPNIQLNIPVLDGTTDAPSANDYARLAEAARYVAQAYENAGNEAQADAYRKAADWYDTMQ